MDREPATAARLDLEEAVSLYYTQVYRFAFFLAGNEPDAKDLTQYAYEQLTRCRAQIMDPTKVRAWLQSTLYRKFIDQRRKVVRFPSVEIEHAPSQAQAITTDPGRKIDAQAALEALNELEEELRLPLSLFYLKSCSYKEIASILGIPTGTVMSRLFRGKEKLYQQLGGGNR